MNVGRDTILVLLPTFFSLFSLGSFYNKSI